MARNFIYPLRLYARDSQIVANYSRLLPHPPVWSTPPPTPNATSLTEILYMKARRLPSKQKRHWRTGPEDPAAPFYRNCTTTDLTLRARVSVDRFRANSLVASPDNTRPKPISKNARAWHAVYGIGPSYFPTHPTLDASGCFPITKPIKGRLAHREGCLTRTPTDHLNACLRACYASAF